MSLFFLYSIVSILINSSATGPYGFLFLILLWFILWSIDYWEVWFKNFKCIWVFNSVFDINHWPDYFVIKYNFYEATVWILWFKQWLSMWSIFINVPCAWKDVFSPVVLCKSIISSLFIILWNCYCWIC